MTSTAKRGWQAAALAALALASALVLAMPAQAATSHYPAGGSDFGDGAQGWTGSEESCAFIIEPLSLCDTETAVEADTGNPGGAIAVNVDVTLNLLGLFEGTALWTSPSFTVPAGEPVTGASAHLDRAFDAGELIDLGPTSEAVVTLVDETGGGSTQLLSESLGDDSSYVPSSVDVPAGVVVGGHSYRLEIATTTTSTIATIGLFGESSTRFDNVRLTVVTQDSGGPGDGDGDGDGNGGSGDGGSGGSGGAGGPGGAGGANVSSGVRIVRGPVSGATIAGLMRSLNLNAEVGRGPGGSLVPLSQCTIVGTPRSDRIVATRGNDVICGLGGGDVIAGAGGRDVIDGGNGNDRLHGGRQGDLLIGLRGADRLWGAHGHDRIGGGDHADRLGGGAGRDSLIGRRGRDRIHGGPGADRLMARDRGRDVVLGGSGRDIAFLDDADRRLARNIARVR